MSKKRSLKNFQSQEVKARVLGVGTHAVKIHDVIVVNDRMKDLKGTMKTAEELERAGVDYDDDQPQLAVVMSNKDGVFTHRFNTKGFVRYPELTDHEGFIESRHPAGYAVSESSNERVEDTDRSDSCWSILDSFCKNAGLPVGSPTDELVGCQLQLILGPTEYGGKERVEMTGSKPAIIETVPAEEETAEDSDNF